MNRRKMFSVLIISVCMFMFGIMLCGCDEETNHNGETKVVFELEGGEYRSSKKPIVYYYKFTKEKNLIKDPSDIARELSEDGIKADIKNPGYKLDGWYKSKILENGKEVYKDKWDFSTDLVDKAGITLYACWKQILTNSFDIYALNEDGTEEFLLNYSIDEGKSLPNTIAKVKKRAGYTFLKYLDKDKNVLEDGFTHPGSADYSPVKIYAQYIDGVYSVVRTKKELKKCVNAIKNTKEENKDLYNIYLDADIDMEGEELFFKNYKGTFRGNNHTISNFYLVKENSIVKERVDNGVLSISLFNSMEDAVVMDVKFTDVKVEFNADVSYINELYIKSLTTSMKNSILKNVSFSGTYKVLTDTSRYDNYGVLNDKVCDIFDELSKIENTIINFNEEK